MFFKKKKQKQEPQANMSDSSTVCEQKADLQQDLSIKAPEYGSTFIIELFMKNTCEMPSKERIAEIMASQLGEVDVYSHTETNVGVAAKDYIADFEDVKIPIMLNMLITEKPAEFTLDALTTSQFWDCKDGKSIIDQCPYMVFANDMMSFITDAKKKARLLTGFTLALMELFPTCEAVLFCSSGKLLTREQILSFKDDPHMFVLIGVNARFFNIQGTEDMMVDTLGLGTLCLPDIQFHFHGADHNAVINHAYNLAVYLFENGDILKDDDTVDGLNAEMRLDQNVQWLCRHEESLIQPARLVIDVNMGEYASGNRE